MERTTCRRCEANKAPSQRPTNKKGNGDAAATPPTPKTAETNTRNTGKAPWQCAEEAAVQARALRAAAAAARATGGAPAEKTAASLEEEA
eukprot:7964241-Prorocentrum_lima.AAC.1